MQRGGGERKRGASGLHRAHNTRRMEREREREESGRERERLSLESVKTIMQTDTLEMRCRLPWQQALGWLEVVVVVVGGVGGGEGRGEDGRGCEDRWTRDV